MRTLRLRVIAPGGYPVVFDPSRILTRALRVTLGLESPPSKPVPAPPLRPELQAAMDIWRRAAPAGSTAQCSAQHWPVAKGQPARTTIRRL